MDCALLENVIPETKYGYWIDATGQFISVNFHEHAKVLQDLGIGYYYADAFEKGWVRVVALPSSIKVSIEFNSEYITKAAFSALFSWLSKENKTEFYGEDSQTDSDSDLPSNVGPVPIGKGRVWVRALMKENQLPEQLTETVIPETKYGYWIDTNGTFIPVPLESHSNIARMHGFKEKYDAIDNGWIRIISAHRAFTEIAFNSTNITKPALTALINWMYEFRSQSEFHIDDETQGVVPSVSKYIDGPIETEKYIKNRIDISYRKKRAAQRNGNLLETIIPHSEYGYWITDKGEFIPVGFYSHLSVANKFEKESYVDAYKSGWIRIVGTPTDDRLIADFDARYIARHALGTLFRWVNESIFTSFSCTDVDCDGDRLSPHSKISLGNGVYVHAKELAPTDQRKFMGFIRLATQNAKQKITESIIPETDYGYWVDENGRFIPVSNRAGHASVLYVLINSTNNDDAFQIGYIRVITTNRDIMVQYDPLRVSKRALNEVIRWASSENVRNYIVSLKNEMGTHKENFIRTTELNQFVTFLRKSIAKELTENVLPESKYGYWITKSGEYIPVGYEQHETELRKIGMADSTGYGSYTKAFQDGWIRVVAKGSLTADIDSRYVTDRAIRALNNLIKIKGYDMYMSASDKFAYKNKEIGYYVASVDLLEFNRFIRSRLAIGRKEAAEAANSPKSIFEAILRF